MKIKAVGMPWCEREDWGEFRRVLADGARMPESYDHWRAFADQQRMTFEAQGLTVILARIEPRKFAEWCQKNGLNVADAAARNRFAIEAAERAVMD